MPTLKILDISDNPLQDDGIKLDFSNENSDMFFFVVELGQGFVQFSQSYNLFRTFQEFNPYFVEMSERDSHFADLKVENCELSCNGVSQLVGVLSTLKRPLDSLSIGENGLGSKVGAPLGKFLGTGIQALDIEDIGLGSSGFLELQKEIGEDLKLAYINMSKNRGGIGSAKFLTTLIPRAPELVAVNAGYNFMPSESLSVICSTLKVAKGKLKHVDLTGNNWHDHSAVASLLDEFQINGKPIFVFPSLPASNAPYDDEP